jgi:serine/threonine protein kinase
MASAASFRVGVRSSVLNLILLVAMIHGLRMPTQPLRMGSQLSTINASQWQPNGYLLEAVSYPSIAVANSSILAFGGCLDAACANQSRHSHQYDLLQGQVISLPDLQWGLAGRGAVTVLDRIYITRMCSMLTSAEAMNITNETIRKFTTVEVMDLDANQTFTLNIKVTQARANATCVGYNAPLTMPTIFVIGGVLLPSLELTNTIAVVQVQTLTYKDVVHNLLYPVMNMAGYGTSAALYIGGGHGDRRGTPRFEFYNIFLDALGDNLPICVSEMSQSFPKNIDKSLTTPWNDIQMVGYANWHIVLSGGTLIYYSDLNPLPTWETIPANDMAWGPTDQQWFERSGYTLVLVPYWVPAAPGVPEVPVQAALLKIGGSARMNVTIPNTTAAPTQPVTTTQIPLTTTTTAAPPPPTTTTTPPPTTTMTTTTSTTSAPTTATASGAPTPAPNTTMQPAPVFRGVAPVFGGTSTTAPASTIAPPSPPTPAPPTGPTETVDVMLANVTLSWTDITLPSLGINSTHLYSTEWIQVNLTSAPDDVDGTQARCFDSQGSSSAGDGAGNCAMYFASDPQCLITIGSKQISLQTRNFTVQTPPSPQGEPFWMCFTYGPKVGQYVDSCPPTFSPDEPRLRPFFVLNFMSPFVIEQPVVPTVAPPPGGSPRGAPSLDQALTIVFAVLAVLLIAALVAVILFLRRRFANAVRQNAAHAERYTELEEIGRGAFGRVLRVKRNSDGAIFAKKHIDCPHAEVLQEALKEFELLRTLQAHPNIIRVVDMFLNYEVVSAPQFHSANTGIITPLLGGRHTADNHADGLHPGDSAPQMAQPTRHLCIVMDYHPMKDLKLWSLAYPSYIPEPVLCHIAVQTCSVLSFIHQKNVIHRDLKPENILIVSDRAVPEASPNNSQEGHPHSGRGNNPNGNGAPLVPSGYAFPRALQQVVITDFGLAHLVAESRQVGFVGTAIFSAPECVALLIQRHAQTAGGHTPPSIGEAPYAALNHNFTPREASISQAKRSAKHQRSASMGSVTAQCDVWSLGCVLYAVATKRLERHNVRKMFEDVYRPEFRNVVTDDLMRAGYTKAFCDFILRLLQLQPDDRPTARDALKYFRKSNRDGSYSVSDTQKLTAEERDALARRQQQQALLQQQREQAAREQARKAPSSATGTGRIHSGPLRMSEPASPQNGFATSAVVSPSQADRPRARTAREQSPSRGGRAGTASGPLPPLATVGSAGDLHASQQQRPPLPVQQVNGDRDRSRLAVTASMPVSKTSENGNSAELDTVHEPGQSAPPSIDATPRPPPDTDK